jgi:hypothetical protein
MLGTELIRTTMTEKIAIEFFEHTALADRSAQLGG